MTKKLSRNKIKEICIINGVKNFNKFNISSKNKTGKTYWVNPDISCLDKSWLLVLNDHINEILH